MTHVTCWLTAKNRDQLRNPTLGNRVWSTFFYLSIYDGVMSRSSVSFVSACYVCVAVTTMTLVLLQQLLLISQNVTHLEWRRASLRAWTRPSIFPLTVLRRHNVNDRGFCRNWRDFLSNTRRQRYLYTNLPT